VKEEHQEKLDEEFLEFTGASLVLKEISAFGEAHNASPESISHTQDVILEYVRSVARRKTLENKSSSAIALYGTIVTISLYSIAVIVLLLCVASLIGLPSVIGKSQAPDCAKVLAGLVGGGAVAELRNALKRK